MREWDPERYDAWYETRLGRLSDRLESELVFSMADIRTGERALDAGCGTGIYSVRLAGAGVETTGVDSSIEMLGHAREKAASMGLSVNFSVADAVELPFGGRVFDLVLSVGMFCFVKDAKAALGEFNRVLKPGGRLVLGTLNGLSPWAFFRRLKGLFMDTVYRDAEFISPRGLESLLSGAGFEVAAVKTCIHYPPVNNRRLLALARPVERLGSKLAPGLGAFICARAVKR